MTVSEALLMITTIKKKEEEMEEYLRKIDLINNKIRNKEKICPYISYCGEQIFIPDDVLIKEIKNQAFKCYSEYLNMMSDFISKYGLVSKFSREDEQKFLKNIK